MQGSRDGGRGFGGEHSINLRKRKQREGHTRRPVLVLANPAPEFAGVEVVPVPPRATADGRRFPEDGVDMIPLVL